MPRITKEQAQELLWFRGDLRFKLRKEQEQLYDMFSKDTKDFIVANCSRRFGKSFILCLKAIEAALTCPNPYPRIKLATSTAKNLEEFILPAFRIILEDCPEDLWPGWSEGYMRSKKKFVGFPNGAEIQLIGIDRDPDGGRGAYCDLYIIDEAAFVTNLTYIISSVASPMKRGRDGARIILSSTPSTEPAHPFQELCELAKKDGNYIELTVLDNETIMSIPGELDQIKKECLTESDFLREYMCKFVVDETLAITPEFSHKKHVLAKHNRPDYYEFLHKYVAMDLGVKIDLTAILFAYYDYVSKTIVIEGEAEINGPEMTTPALQELIKRRERKLWGRQEPYRRVADNDNPLLLQDLGYLHKMHFMATGKDNLHAMVNEVRTMLKANRIKIHKNCKKLLGCLEYGVWNDKRKQFGRSAMYGHYDHLAALVYLVRNIDQFTNPIPHYYELTDEQRKNMIIKDTKRTSKNAGVLAKLFGINRKP